MTPNLKIGHDRTEMKTLLTEVFAMKDNEDMYLVDSAIFKSTGSDLLDLINTVVIREIMLRAKSIKLVFPLTTTHVDEKDILTIRNSLDSITQLFKGPDFNTLLNSVQPIITKARPTDEGFDIEIKWSDIMQKMNGALENLKAELKKENPNRKASDTEEGDMDRVLKAAHVHCCCCDYYL